jgi:hypothetical protein
MPKGQCRQEVWQEEEQNLSASIHQWQGAARQDRSPQKGERDSGRHLQG